MTQEATPVGCVVTVRDKSMQDPWILACSDQNIDARDAIKRYGKRFTCEELYRDVKDPRFGMGMRWGRVKRTDRRDRMWLLATLAVHLLTLLGEAGEDTGISKSFRSGRSGKRQYSLFKQGAFWYLQIPTIPEKRLRPLMQAFNARIMRHKAFRAAIGFDPEE